MHGIAFARARPVCLKVHVNPVSQSVANVREQAQYLQSA